VKVAERADGREQNPLSRFFFVPRIDGVHVETVSDTVPAFGLRIPGIRTPTVIQGTDVSDGCCFPQRTEVAFLLRSVCCRLSDCVVTKERLRQTSAFGRGSYCPNSIAKRDLVLLGTNPLAYPSALSGAERKSCFWRGSC